jgi:hypothetical protein
MALGPDPRGRFPCYTAKRRDSSTQRGLPIMPWGRPAPPPHPELPRFSTPRPWEPPHITAFREDLALGRARLPHVPPTVGARARTPRVERALASLQVFDAIQTDATAYDASIAVGPSDVVVTTNFTAAVLAKDGKRPLETSLHAWFAQVLPPEVDVVFDPRVLYDQHDDRWVLVASAVHYDNFTRPFLLLSVSQTSDPRRDWWVWGFAESGGDAARWPDHPSLGVDAHALYVSANLFKGLSGEPAIGRLRVLPKAMPYGGGPPSYTDFEGLRNPADEDHPDPTPALTVFPCHTWDAPGVETLVSTRKDHPTERAVTLWTLTDPVGDPELTCRSVSVAPYAVAVPPAAQQDGPALTTGDARVRNAVFSGGSIWFAFATAHQAEATVGAARWYQVDPDSARVVQEGHFAVTDVHHCYPALVPDMHGNATLVVGRAAAGERVSLHVTSRHASDPPGELPPSRPVHDGRAVHDNPDRWERNRWGDYHGAALDPVDRATVWVYGAYPLSEKVWGTSVGALRV